MTQTPDAQVASLMAVEQATSIAGVFCPRCRRQSLDTSFCEHCQFELPSIALATNSSVPASMPSSVWGLDSFSFHWPPDPSAFFMMTLGGMQYRVRGIRPELWPDLRDDVRVRQSIALRALPPIAVLEIRGGALVVAVAWDVSSMNVPSGGSCNFDDVLTDTLRDCRRLSAAMTELHASGHVWLEFDPSASEVKGDELRITNLDWRLFPLGRCPTRLARISPKYSPAEVCQFRDDLIGPRTDVFHLSLAVYYRLAGLDANGFAGRGLEAFGFDVPPLRIYCPHLPAGIWPVLRRGLSMNANNRQATTGELVQQLEWAMKRVGASRGEPNERGRETDAACAESEDECMTGSLTGAKQEIAQKPMIDIGWQTIAGQVKSALGAINQDCVVVQCEPVHSRHVLVMIVADGVTHARVGAGDQASRLACETLIDSIRRQIQACPGHIEPDWPTILEQACWLASEAIVAAALALPNRPAKVNDNDLMSTTALIGILDNRDFYLANVGDSRGYLVTNQFVEQLTVDGDVASSQLARGTAPEQVHELGSAGKALRYCLGACREAENGQLVADRERASPHVGHWRIEPGDHFILCSDGLVEERVFLEPEDLVRIIKANQELSAQKLAECLVQEANRRQRLPSDTELNGYGDNVTCITLCVAVE